MLSGIAEGVDHIYVACGHTDFRKQAESLSALVNLQFHLDPFSSKCVFLFCNKRKSAIKALRWDGNGFLLSSKKLMDEMRFQWPKTPEEVRDISLRELRWLLEGLSIDQPKAHKKIEVPDEPCF